MNNTAIGAILAFAGIFYIASALIPPTSSNGLKINIKIKKEGKRLAAAVMLSMAALFIGLICPQPTGCYLELWEMDITIPVIAGIITAVSFFDNEEDDFFEMIFDCLLYGVLVAGAALAFIYFFFAPQRGVFLFVVGVIIYGSLARKLRNNVIYRAY